MTALVSYFLSGFFGALMLVALFRLVPPSVDRCFFGGGSGGLKSRVIRCLFGVGQESGMSSARFTHLSTLVLCCTGVFAVGYATMGKERVVLVVLCERGKNRLVVVLCSSVGLGIPSWRRAAVSSSQQAYSHTIASSVLMGNGGMGWRQLAC